MNSIFHRVSIRKFQDKPVEPEKIETLLRAAMAAPSARNQQPWEFYVVTNKDLIQKLSTVSPYAGCAKDAQVLIVSAYREDAISPAYAQIDLSIANENIWLEADALSLGGVWLGIAPVEERMKAVKVYVFCLNTNKDIGKRNALTVDDWVFYVVPTFVVDGYCKETPAQKKISLNVVKRLVKEEVSYDRLREAVDEAIVLSDSYYMDK